jgi:heme/copper-type cytochrome/quinol oxidase subunit 1
MRTVAGALAAIALLVIAWVLWSGELSQTAFGWFAYEPLPDDISSSVVLMTGRRVMALAVGALGLLFLGFTAGFAVARRSGYNSA